MAGADHRDEGRLHRAQAWLWGSLLMALLPMSVVAVQTARFGFDFPYWDGWHLAPYLEKAATQGLTLHDFWVQHNEHRPLFPRLVMVTLARLSAWNGALELAASGLLAFGALGALWSIALRTAPGRRAVYWVVPLLSALVFSWGQMENWVWGWQLQVFMSTAAVAAGIAALSGEGGGATRLAASIACGVVASYSFANGLLFWFAALPALWWAPGVARAARPARLGVWALAAALTIGSYFTGYQKPEVSPSLLTALHFPVQFAAYFILYVGAPVTALWSRPAWHGVDAFVLPAHYLPGAAGLIALALVVRAVSRDAAGRSAAAPWIAVASYALLSALVTAAGRAGFGLGQALTSRYFTISTLYWCALCGLLALWASGRPAPAPVRTAVGYALLALAIVAAQFGLVRSNREWEEIARWKRMGYTALRAGNESWLFLQDLCWDPKVLKHEYLPILKRHGLAGFGTAAPGGPALARAYLDEARHFARATLWLPAAAYADTALILDPGLDEARQIREAAGRAIDAARLSPPPLEP